MIRGKKEFSEFVTAVNKEVSCDKLNLPPDSLECLKNLIDIWKEIYEDDDFIYLQNIDEYEEITDYIKKHNKYSTVGISWFYHVDKILSHKMSSSDKEYISLNLACVEFKLKYFEDWNKLCRDEIKLLDFFRKIEAIAYLTKGNSYIQKQFIDKLLLNNTRLPYTDIKSNWIEVRDSPLHGKGVFATDDIPENTIITFYPCDGYCTDGSNNFHTNANLDSSCMTDIENYCFVVDDTLKIVANKNNTTNKMLLGHIINDSVGDTFSNKPSFPYLNSHDIKDGIYEYVMKSDNNCTIKVNKKHGLIYVLTTKYIYKDEELLTSYSPIFWFSRVSEDQVQFYSVCSSGKMVEFLKNNVFN